MSLLDLKTNFVGKHCSPRMTREDDATDRHVEQCNKFHSLSFYRCLETQLDFLLCLISLRLLDKQYYRNPGYSRNISNIILVLANL